MERLFKGEAYRPYRLRYILMQLIFFRVIFCFGLMDGLNFFCKDVLILEFNF
ncbi:MAG: hypothetical protein LBH59_10715 [Planctomycetaceae bacterium]|nr:hypothetical protein [Planctomycetaceae bacterium]